MANTVITLDGLSVTIESAGEGMDRTMTATIDYTKEGDTEVHRIVLPPVTHDELRHLLRSVLGEIEGAEHQSLIESNPFTVSLIE